MDRETDGNKGFIGNLGQVYQGRIDNFGDFSGNLSNSDNGVALETITVINSGEKVAAVMETEVLNANIEGLGFTERVANEGAGDGKRIRESLDEGTLSNSSNMVNETVLETVIVMNSGATSSVNGENKDLGSENELGLRGGVINQETRHVLGDGEVLNRVGQGSSRYLSNSVNGVVLETVIVIDSEEHVGINGGNQRLEAKETEMRSSKETVDESKTKMHIGGKSSCVIDMTCGGDESGGGGFEDNCDGERLCRICHLTSEGLLEATDTTITATTTSMDLIQLGCGCKDELGIAHVYCAEAWFKLKGNRICEICGVTAMNITGIGDNRFLERRFVSSGGVSSEHNGGCLRGQPFCNFLLACLVIAFVLPWFFRVDMF